MTTDARKLGGLLRNDWAESFGSQGVAMMLIAGRTNNGFMAETAFQQIETALETLRLGGQERWAAIFQASLTEARAIRDRLKGSALIRCAVNSATLVTRARIAAAASASR